MLLAALVRKLEACLELNEERFDPDAARAEEQRKQGYVLYEEKPTLRKSGAPRNSAPFCAIRRNSAQFSAIFPRLSDARPVVSGVVGTWSDEEYGLAGFQWMYLRYKSFQVTGGYCHRHRHHHLHPYLHLTPPFPPPALRRDVGAARARRRRRPPRAGRPPPRVSPPESSDGRELAAGLARRRPRLRAAGRRLVRQVVGGVGRQGAPLAAQLRAQFARNSRTPRRPPRPPRTTTFASRAASSRTRRRRTISRTSRSTSSRAGTRTPRASFPPIARSRFTLSPQPSIHAPRTPPLAPQVRPRARLPIRTVGRARRRRRAGVRRRLGPRRAGEGRRRGGGRGGGASRGAQGDRGRRRGVTGPRISHPAFPTSEGDRGRRRGARPEDDGVHALKHHVRYTCTDAKPARSTYEEYRLCRAPLAPLTAARPTLPRCRCYCTDDETADFFAELLGPRGGVAAIIANERGAEQGICPKLEKRGARWDASRTRAPRRTRAQPHRSPRSSIPPKASSC